MPGHIGAIKVNQGSDQSRQFMLEDGTVVVEKGDQVGVSTVKFAPENLVMLELGVSVACEETGCEEKDSDSAIAKDSLTGNVFVSQWFD